MKRSVLGLVAMLAMALGGGSAAWAQSYYGPVQYQIQPVDYHGGSGGCDVCGNDHCGCDSWCGGMFLEAESTLFRYHRDNGLRVGDDAGGDDIVPGSFDAAPRLTLGYVAPNGLGMRVRWWEFHQSLVANEGAPSRLDVETYTIDTEVFERFQLNRDWDIELSAGFRYNAFDESLQDLVGDDEIISSGFDGFGGLLGFEARRAIGWGSLFGRSRHSILMDDTDRIFIENVNGTTVVASETLHDTVKSITEIAIGWELSRQTAGGSILYTRIAGEWQHWENYSTNFTGEPQPALPVISDPEQVFTGSSDVGFVGMTFSLGFIR